jgi:hypothetical protein
MQKVIYDEGQGIRALRGQVTEEKDFFRIKTISGDDILLNKRVVIRVSPVKEATDPREVKR